MDSLKPIRQLGGVVIMILCAFTMLNNFLVVSGGEAILGADLDPAGEFFANSQSIKECTPEGIRTSFFIFGGLFLGGLFLAKAK